MCFGLASHCWACIALLAPFWTCPCLLHIPSSLRLEMRCICQSSGSEVEARIIALSNKMVFPDTLARPRPHFEIWRRPWGPQAPQRIWQSTLWCRSHHQTSTGHSIGETIPHLSSPPCFLWPQPSLYSHANRAWQQSSLRSFHEIWKTSWNTYPAAASRHF